MFTIPNALSVLRGALIPVFLTLAADRRDGLALMILAIASLTDYFDGKVARWLHQESKLGAILDPMFDRFYIAASLYVLWDRGIFPTWLVIILIVRDLILLLVNLELKRRRLGLLGAFVAAGAVIGLARTFVGDLAGGDAAYGVLFGSVFAGLATGIALGPKIFSQFSRRRLFGAALTSAGFLLICISCSSKRNYSTAVGKVYEFGFCWDVRVYV